MDITKYILEKLKEIERSDNVTIIYACESGSRAWGFASEDSDYDVRFIYVRRKNRYLSISGQDSTIDINTSLNLETRDIIRESVREQDVDFAGWDVEKVLQQIWKGNPQLAEWFQSPIIYTEKEPFSSRLRDMSSQYYKTKAGIYHYEHMARGNFNKYILGRSDTVLMKKYLYVLRPLFAMKWIDLYGNVPPMEFEKTLSDSGIKNNTEPYLLAFTQNLINMKRAGTELGFGPHDGQADTLILGILDHFVGPYPYTQKFKASLWVDREDLMPELDKFFCDVVCELEN